MDPLVVMVLYLANFYHNYRHDTSGILHFHRLPPRTGGDLTYGK
jgi:hypothetical protein